MDAMLGSPWWLTGNDVDDVHAISHDDWYELYAAQEINRGEDQSSSEGT